MCYREKGGRGTANASVKNAREHVEETPDQLFDCSELLSKLVENEEKCFSSVEEARNKNDQSHVPTWVKTFAVTSLHTPEHENRIVMSDLAPFHCMICDLMIGLMLGTEWKCNVLPMTRADQIHVSYASNALLKIRRDNGRHPFNSFREMEFVLKSASAFFDASSCTFGYLMSENDKDVLQREGWKDMDMLDVLIQGVLDYCDFIQHSFPKDSASTRSALAPISLDIIQSLWRLYQSMVAEDPTRRLIQAIEKKFVVNKPSDIPSGTKLSSLKSMSSPDHVDHIVRGMRLGVISAFLSVVKYHSNTFSFQSPFIPPSSGETELLESSVLLNNYADQKEQMHPGQVQLFWLESIKSLCIDLSAGLEGNSGGVTPFLYDIFLRAINSCINCAINTLDELPENMNNEIGDLLNICQDSSIILWNILCKFNLKHASLLKMTLMLSMWRLPSLCHQLKVIAMQMPPNLKQRTTATLDLCLVTTLLKQCKAYHAGKSNTHIDNSKERNSKNAPSQEPWKDDSNCHQNDHVSVSFDKEKEGRAQLCPAKHICYEKIRIPSAECWCWTYKTSLLAAERIWMDSNKLLREGPKQGNVDRKRLSEASQYLIIDYMAKRVEILFSILESVSSILPEICRENDDIMGGAQDVSSDSNTNANKLKLRDTEIFPFAGKLRLCSCLEQVSWRIKIYVELCFSKFVGNWLSLHWHCF